MTLDDAYKELLKDVEFMYVGEMIANHLQIWNMRPLIDDHADEVVMVNLPHESKEDSEERYRNLIKDIVNDL
jgi:hypothetical protein